MAKELAQGLLGSFWAPHQLIEAWLLAPGGALNGPKKDTGCSLARSGSRADTQPCVAEPPLQSPRDLRLEDTKASCPASSTYCPSWSMQLLGAGNPMPPTYGAQALGSQCGEVPWSLEAPVNTLHLSLPSLQTSTTTKLKRKNSFDTKKRTQRSASVSRVGSPESCSCSSPTPSLDKETAFLRHPEAELPQVT